MTQSAGSFTSTGNVYVGELGPGTLTVSGGSFSNHVNVDDNFNTTVGDTRTGEGALNIQDTGSYTTKELDAGFNYLSTGTINQTGGTLNIQSLNLGVFGYGTYDLSGGSATCAGTLDLGFYSSGYGKFHISNDAVFTSTNGGITVGDNGVNCLANIDGGTMNLDNGAIDVAHSPSSSGVVNQTAGSVNAQSMLVGDGASTDGEYNLSGGHVNLSTEARIGSNGVGRMTISGDGALNAVESVHVGYGATGQGTLTQTGGALNADALRVGNDGTGLYTYTGGSAVVTGNTYVGYGDASSGTIDFGSGGATLSTRGLFASASQITGIGSIETKGLVSDENLTFDSAASLDQTLSWGTVAVHLDLTGGAEANGPLGAGWHGTGSLAIEGDANVVSSAGYLGFRTGSTGTATVGGTAAWGTGDLTVGREGNGTLTQSSGTVNVQGNCTIGSHSSGVGVYNLNGGTLNVGGGLIIADEGTGTLNVGGGLISMNGGGVYSGIGTPAFNFQGGTLRNAAEVASPVNLQSGGTGAVFQQDAGFDGLVSAKISGTGPLTKTGGGVLTLSGANNYSGLTALQAGTLKLESPAHNAVLTLGGVDVQGGQLLFDYNGGADPVDTIRSNLHAGYVAGNGSLDSGMMYTSTGSALGYGLGYIDDAQASTVTVGIALYGDTNLDNTVNLLDLAELGANWHGTDRYWYQGDFNYDGVVNLLDLAVLGENWHASTAGMSFSQALSMVTFAVPEPGTLALLVCGLAGLLAYVWRKRR